MGIHVVQPRSLLQWIGFQANPGKQRDTMFSSLRLGLNGLTHSSIMTAANPPLKHSLLDMMKNLAGASFFTWLQIGMEVSALNGKAHPQEHRVHDPYAMTRRLWPCVGVSLGGQVDNFFQRTSSDILSLMDRAITSHSVPFDSKAHRHGVWKTWERPVRGWRLVAKRRCLLSCISNSNTDVRRYVFPF